MSGGAAADTRTAAVSETFLEYWEIKTLLASVPLLCVLCTWAFHVSLSFSIFNRWNTDWQFTMTSTKRGIWLGQEKQEQKTKLYFSANFPNIYSKVIQDQSS